MVMLAMVLVMDQSLVFNIARALMPLPSMSDAEIKILGVFIDVQAARSKKRNVHGLLP